MRLSGAETNAPLTLLRSLLTVHPLTLDTHETGLALAERYGLSTYDAMIAASALGSSGDALLYSNSGDALHLL
jgi:predicted nucleic acid-binding protein